jgi:Uma2 family endonuclease
MATVLELPEQKVILDGVSWDTYTRLLEEHECSSGTRFNYDDGALEIMVLSAEHERLKQALTTLVVLIAAEMGIDIDAVGSTTFRREDISKGFEADSSFYIQNRLRVAGKTRIDLNQDPPPDLVIEIDITSPSLNKLPLYAALGVPEVWRNDGSSVTILRLSNQRYAEVEASEALPGVKADRLAALIDLSKTMSSTEWVRLVRATAQAIISSQE